MRCNGICSICRFQCFRGELKEQKSETPPLTAEAVESANQVFDNAVQETGMVVVEPTEVYTIKKNLFGKEKVVRVK